MATQKQLTAQQIIQRSYLVTMAAKVLNMNPTDIAAVFKITRETVYNILSREDLSKLNIEVS